jgi:cysteinyl-tRNA synthetase
LSFVLDNSEKLSGSAGDKFSLYVTQLKNCSTAADLISTGSGSGDETKAKEFLSLVEDVISQSLDAAHGQEVTDHKIFQDLASYWENEYFKDMERLNVKPPTVLTRVSQYVPEIIDFVATIISNGFAYNFPQQLIFSFHFP